MFNTMNTGYSLSDIAAVSRDGNNDGFGGNNAWWIILLFLVCGWGGRGFGGGYGNGTETANEIAYGFDMNGLENGIRGVQQGLCDGFYAMNTGMLNGFSGVQNALCQGFSGINAGMTQNTNALQAAINENTVAGMQNTNGLLMQLNAMQAANDRCCCATERLMEKGFCDINYNLATQSCETRRTVTDSTRDIIDNQNAGVRSILDFLTQDKISSLQAENQALRFEASQKAQNAYLINELGQKAPIPAYTVPNPYAYYYAGCCCNG